MSDPTPTPAPAPKREYDQILSGNVTIKKICNSDNEYKITFSKNKKYISKVLIYQTWSDSNTPEGKYLNEHRKVFEVNAIDWVKATFSKDKFSNVKKFCTAPAYFAPVSCKDGKKYENPSLADCDGQKDCKSYISFTPTCVMELKDGECPIHDHKNEECRHVFVINNAKVKDGHVVFYVSSQDIDPNNKNKVIENIKKIPKGEFHHARFDIDWSFGQWVGIITDS
jgi:hypothetical protein